MYKNFISDRAVKITHKFLINFTLFRICKVLHMQNALTICLDASYMIGPTSYCVFTGNNLHLGMTRCLQLSYECYSSI